MNSLVSLGTSGRLPVFAGDLHRPWVFPENSRERRISRIGGRGHHLVLVGRLLEARPRRLSGKAVQSLIRLRPRTALSSSATSADNVDGSIEWRNRRIHGHRHQPSPPATCWSSRATRVPTDGVIVAGERVMADR